MDLQQAIDKILIELTTMHASVSAYDVTQELRKRVKDGTLTITSLADTITVDNQVVPRIEHFDVRNAVHNLFAMGKYPGYSRTHNGTYYVYGYADPQDPPAASGSSYDGTPTL